MIMGNKTSKKEETTNVADVYPLNHDKISAKFKRDFPGKGRDSEPAILPVIHVFEPLFDKSEMVTDDSEGSGTFYFIKKNIELVEKYKFDGIFLINHGFRNSVLESVIIEVRKKYPKLWIGANFLGASDPIPHLLNCQKQLNGLWVDNGKIIVKNTKNNKNFSTNDDSDSDNNSDKDSNNNNSDSKNNEKNENNNIKKNENIKNDKIEKEEKKEEKINESDFEFSKYFSDKGALKRGKSLYIDNKFDGLYFGGVDFKYISMSQIDKSKMGNENEYYDKCKNLGIFASKGCMDVICTSGKGTGKSADPLKMKAYQEGTRNRALLAVASGVTPENVINYLGSVDAILIATGIESEFGILDEKKMEKLRNAIDENTQKMSQSK